MKHYIIKVYQLIFFNILLFLIFNISFAQKATISESKEVFKTYPFSDPNPIAYMNNIYPYYRFDGYSSKSKNQEWKVITLENPYIKVFVLPEIGGKIWGAIEKSTGIEFNFGDIGHAPTTATPVDYFIKENEDGSVSCFIGATDLPSRTEWKVEIRLQKDKSYFETHSTWYNSTELNTSLYNWTNAAIEASPDLQLFYPGTNYLDHDGKVYPYPINDKGINISIYGNNNFGSYKSYHVIGEYTDFFGGIWKGNNFGVVHHSLYDNKPGKKIWIWGLSREGEIWKDLLTDPEKGNKQYVEIQSGILLNQAAAASSKTPFKHSFLTPYNIERFSEIWFPIKGLENIVDANSFGALSLLKGKNSIKFGICPTQKMQGDLKVKVKGKEVYNRNLVLEPMKSINDNIVISEADEIEISFGGGVLYYNTDENKKLNRPIESNKEFDWNSVFGLYSAAKELDRQRDQKGALSKYLECLKKEPLYSPALIGAAEIYYKNIEYKKALEYIRLVLQNDAYDPAANYIYGIVNRKLGYKYDAIDGFGFAAKSLEFRSAAYLQIAEIHFIDQKYDKSTEYATRALDYNRLNMNAFKLLVLNLRKQHRAQDAKRYLDYYFDPLSHFYRFEIYLVDSKPNNLEMFKSYIRNELPHETYLELALYYLNLDLIDDAVMLLENAPSHPIINYWLAFLYEEKGDTQKSLSYIDKAVNASPKLVFPFRRETSEILEWAKSKTKSWKTSYYLALNYWNNNRIDLADKLFKECGNIPDYVPFYLTRASFYKMNFSDHADQIIIDYLKALDLDKNEWRTYHLLTEYLNTSAKYDKALVYSKNGSKLFHDSYIMQFDYAKTLLYNGEYKECLDILNKIDILPYEGARDGREIYWKANILSAFECYKDGAYKKAVEFIGKSRLWPENLGVGKPFDEDTRLEDYLESLCQDNLGNKEASTILLNRIIEYSNSNFQNWGPNCLISALALKNSGKVYEANKMMDEWLNKDRSNLIADWSFAKFNNDNTKADEIYKKSNLFSIEKIEILSGKDFYFKLIHDIVK
jgi:tetratricopeptide (TPR) repeat protein